MKRPKNKYLRKLQRINLQFPESIYNWFVATDGHENEAAKLFDATNEIIRRITRYAAELSEKNSLGANRKEEYKKVAELFMKCEDVDEAHKMSAMVFGIERPVHISGDYDRVTDSMNQGVYEEEPICIELKPRIRAYRMKTKRSSIVESTEKKLEIRKKMLQQQNAMESVDFSSRTDDGRTYQLEKTSGGETCTVHCEDGNFTMPKMRLIFGEKPI